MAKKEAKTNAMRILEKAGISFTSQTYDCPEFTDGIHAADLLSLPHEEVFKTLVTVGKSQEYYVFVIPVAEEIDFKKASKAVNEKSLILLPLKDLTTVTGYIRGGCTAIGMKKEFVTIIHSSAECLNQIHISGGRRGLQLTLSPVDLKKITHAVFSDVISYCYRQ